MKFNKIIAMILILALAVCSLVACGEKEAAVDSDELVTDENGNVIEENSDAPIELAADEIAVNVLITTDEFDAPLAEGTVVLKQGATVLDAIAGFCDDEGIECVYEEVEDGENPTTVQDLGNYKSTSKEKEETEKFIYYWQILVNDVELAGVASDNEVSSEDVVRYHYTSIPNGPWVTVRFENEGEVLVEDTVVVYEAGDTVLEAADEALKMSGVEYAKTETGIQSVGDCLAKKTPIYDDIWEVTVNDVKYDSETELTTIALAEEQVIVFNFSRVEK